MTSPRTSVKKPPMIIGWREKIALPDLGIPSVHAKIDTGARTSAIHATHIRPFDRDGAPWVKFHIPHASGLRARDVEAPLLGERAVKNTSGEPQDRLVIETLLVIGNRHWQIEVTLADRANMAMPIILGRTAIRRRRILVDAGRSFLAGEPVAPGQTIQTRTDRKEVPQ
jgi:hypothetical protein